jgi:ABC-2 type transport system ATP-binding protein
MNVVETHGLGRRYGSTWALEDCSLTIPEGHLTALVGPNGAGKTTLLNLMMGLSTPSTGDITVLDGLRPGSFAALNGIGFVAQDTPVYRGFSVADMVKLTKNLNLSFDSAFARRRLADLGIGLRKRAGQLSGGQRAQLALTLALARHPRLLVLDEPTAALDPLARHDFMATVMAAMADDGVSVVLSSHLLAELERVADHLVLMAAGRNRLAGTVDDLLADHRLLTTRSGPVVPHQDWEVVEEHAGGAQTRQLVRLRHPEVRLPPGCDVRPVGIEELAMGYLRSSANPVPVPQGALRLRSSTPCLPRRCARCHCASWPGCPGGATELRSSVSVPAWSHWRRTCWSLVCRRTPPTTTSGPAYRRSPRMPAGSSGTRSPTLTADAV